MLFFSLRLETELVSWKDNLNLVNPTISELNSSIQSLIDYKERLKGEFTLISKKLRITGDELEKTLESHEELKYINSVINRLTYQRDQQISNSKWEK